MQRRHVAIVMPAYNEAEGLTEFIDEIYREVAPVVEKLSVIVVNDRSTDNTGDVLKELERRHSGFVGITALRNQGHGPTALSAYRAALELNPDVVLHVDGDGQFLARDLVRLLAGQHKLNADVAHGVRRGRTDPWFRKVITALVGVIVTLTCGRRVPDVNTPLRVYRPEVLRTLLARVPENAQVPHVHFSIAEKKLGYRVAYLRVASIPRRASEQNGTMWGSQPSKPLLPPKRLRAFVRTATREVWQLSLRPGAAEEAS